MTTLVKSSGPHVLGRAESEILITCQNRRGMDVRAIPLRISRHSATFEVYNPYSVVQVAEVLRNLNIYVDGYSVYAGRGVVTHLMNTGLLVICEVLLEDAWQSTSAAPAVIWQRLQKLFLEYPAGSGTVSSQFTDALDRLGGYLDAGCVALGGNSTRVGSQSLPSNPPTPERVREAMDDLGAALSGVDTIDRLQHRKCVRAETRSLIVPSSLAQQIILKPMDFLPDPLLERMAVWSNVREVTEAEGEYGAYLNECLRGTSLVQAIQQRHNESLALLRTELERRAPLGRRIRILSFGVGPFLDLLDLIGTTPASDLVDIVLWQSGQDTTPSALSEFKTMILSHERQATVRAEARSVSDILRDAGKGVWQAAESFDIILCTGLMEYLSDRISKRVAELLFDILAPGGVMLLSNFSSASASSGALDLLIDWHHIGRSREQMRGLLPTSRFPVAADLTADSSGSAFFLRVENLVANGV